MGDETKKTHRFEDASGLFVCIKHEFVSLETQTNDEPCWTRRAAKTRNELHRQPCSKIYVEIPDNCSLSMSEVYEAITGHKPPADFKPKDRNKLIIGTVIGMSDQLAKIELLKKSQLFEDDTILKVNKSCNNPNPPAEILTPSISI